MWGGHSFLMVEGGRGGGGGGGQLSRGMKVRASQSRPSVCCMAWCGALTLQHVPRLLGSLPLQAVNPSLAPASRAQSASPLRRALAASRSASGSGRSGADGCKGSAPTGGPVSEERASSHWSCTAELRRSLQPQTAEIAPPHGSIGSARQGGRERGGAVGAWSPNLPADWARSSLSTTEALVELRECSSPWRCSHAGLVSEVRP